MNHKSGFIAIIGRPNAGKSTLLNALLKQKVAIMSDKPNTTRNNIAGILTYPDVQYVFVDTPGIHKPQQQLGRVLNKNAYMAMEDCDCIVWINDASQPFGKGDQFILDRISSLNKKVILLLNKIDTLTKEEMMKVLIDWQDRYDFKAMIPISALKQDNLDELLKVIKEELPEGVSLFPDEMISDHDENFQITEIIREKILNYTKEEIPHSVAVILENREETEKQIVLQALVIVDRPSQKGILIGKQGSMIKRIRLSAQKELKNKFHKNVSLELYVRVEKNWRNQEQKIKEFGLDELNDD
ncbi:GTPase Era [uncultured Faecalicoccus sp.]|uniref:GTPase Era n=1 Tax=uncultured Faecalicoccus sp. TaxID=1971760 RepID=UPI00260C5840|nr:GTPase Era [uncultured Faecalicoccus sp.]